MSVLRTLPAERNNVQSYGNRLNLVSFAQRLLTPKYFHSTTSVGIRLRIVHFCEW